MKLWRIQGEVYPNLKCLHWGLLQWYVPSSWWYRVPRLVNLHDTWWMCRYLYYPSSPLENIELQEPAPPPSSSAMCLANFPWWVWRGAASRRFLRLWPHGQVVGARFVEIFVLIIEIFVILRSMEWPVPDYQDTLVFINLTGEKFPRCIYSYFSSSFILVRSPWLYSMLIIGWYYSIPEQRL